MTILSLNIIYLCYGLLYTTGRALELQHLRWNTDCNVWEELPPIVFNPNYDFDYQQFLYLPREVTILPVRSRLVSKHVACGKLHSYTLIFLHRGTC